MWDLSGVCGEGADSSLWDGPEDPVGSWPSGPQGGFVEVAKLRMAWSTGKVAQGLLPDPVTGTAGLGLSCPFLGGLRWKPQA